jgi:hypothetical protein
VFPDKPDTVMTRAQKRRWIATGLGLGLLVAAGIEERVRGAWLLRSWQREARARGERLTPAELDPARSNVTHRVVTPTELMGLLPSKGTTQDPAAPRALPPGRELVLWRLDAWPGRRDSTNPWRDYARELGSVRAQLPGFRATLAARPWVVQLDYSAGPNLMMPHLGRLKETALALRAVTLVELREGRLDEALMNLVAGRELLEIQRRDGLVLSHLVRLANGQIALGALWQALQAEGWTDAQLAQMQALWREPGFLEGMMTGLRMERAIAAPYFTGGQGSHAELFSLFEQSGSAGRSPEALIGEYGWFGPVLAVGQRLRQQAFLELWRFAWAAQDQAFHHRVMQSALDAAETARVTRNARELRPAGPAGTPEASGTDWRWATANLNAWGRLRHWLSISSLASTQEMLWWAARGEAYATLAHTAVALHRYRLRSGRWPERLDALVPEVLPAVPTDWLDGQPVRYRLRPDGTFLLYSVGVDGVDDGGDARPPAGAQESLLRGRDLVWPTVVDPAPLGAGDDGARRARGR